VKRPNIVVLYTDQQRWDTFAANGNHIIETPNLDALARTGVNFGNCIAQNPVCMPSRISMLTGRYCSALGITHMAVTVPPETETLPKILASYGYRNGLIGKLHFLPHSNRDHRELHPPYYFHHMELSDEPGCYEDAYRAWVRRKAPGELDNVSVGLPPVAAEWQRLLGVRDGVVHPDRMEYRARPFPARSDVSQAAFVGEQTAEYIHNRGPEPFFCFAGFYSPHSPWVAPQEFLDLYRDEDMPLPNYPPDYPPGREERFAEASLRSITRGYYAMISEVDHWIGKILDAVEESGKADNTIIVFTSDHGEWLGEHRKFGKGHWAPDVVSRVPLIVRIPEAIGGRSGETVDDIVECADVVPSLLHAAGIPIPPKVQGDLLPAFDTDEIGDGGDGLGLTEHKGWKSLRMPGFRYVAEADGSERLFDLEQDPWEYRDVSAEDSYAGALSDARAALIRRMLRIEQPLPREWPY
jgi:arylsulfatase A-like enzyme